MQTSDKYCNLIHASSKLESIRSRLLSFPSFLTVSMGHFQDSSGSSYCEIWLQKFYALSNDIKIVLDTSDKRAIEALSCWFLLSIGIHYYLLLLFSLQGYTSVHYYSLITLFIVWYRLPLIYLFIYVFIYSLQFYCNMSINKLIEISFDGASRMF